MDHHQWSYTLTGSCFHSTLNIPLHGAAMLALKSTRHLVVREILHVGIPKWDCFLIQEFSIYKL